MTYEIIKINTTEYQILNVETKEIVSTYSRIDSAKRGLKRLLARESAEAVSTASAIGVARATQVADAVDTAPPTSNTGGLIVTRGD